jgi:hypothetical protein
MVQTAVVVEVNVGVRPEDAVADSVGVVPKIWAPGLLKVMVCGAFGVMAAEAVEAALMPAVFLAVTVKV